MSNLDEIKELVEQGTLIEFERRELTNIGNYDTYRRFIYLGHDLNNETSIRSNERTFRRLSALWQNFTSGRTIPVALERDHRSAQWARLDPAHQEVWETRVRHESPELRILGRFAYCDVFVAFHLYEGSELSRPHEWDTAITRCEAEWLTLFPRSSPVIGNRINDYISTNFTLIRA